MNFSRGNVEICFQIAESGRNPFASTFDLRKITSLLCSSRQAEVSRKEGGSGRAFSLESYDSVIMIAHNKHWGILYVALYQHSANQPHNALDLSSESISSRESQFQKLHGLKREGGRMNTHFPGLEAAKRTT